VHAADSMRNVPVPFSIHGVHGPKHAPIVGVLKFGIGTVSDGTDNVNDSPGKKCGENGPDGTSCVIRRIQSPSYR